MAAYGDSINAGLAAMGDAAAFPSENRSRNSSNNSSQRGEPFLHHHSHHHADEKIVRHRNFLILGAQTPFKARLCEMFAAASHGTVQQGAAPDLALQPSFRSCGSLYSMSPDSSSKKETPLLPNKLSGTKSESELDGARKKSAKGSSRRPSAAFATLRPPTRFVTMALASPFGPTGIQYDVVILDGILHQGGTISFDPSVIVGTDAFILTYSVHNRSSFDFVQRIHDKLTHILAPTPYVLVGTTELVSAGIGMSVTADEAQRLAEKWGCKSMFLNNPRSDDDCSKVMEVIHTLIRVVDEQWIESTMGGVGMSKAATDPVPVVAAQYVSDDDIMSSRSLTNAESTGAEGVSPPPVVPNAVKKCEVS